MWKESSRSAVFVAAGPARRSGPTALALTVCLLAAGCGINKSRLATEQLVVSDAVDRAVSEIDFSPLSGRKIYFDTKYLESVKSGTTGNIEYVISSLRQQMAAYDCRLQEKPETAEFVVEARVGVLAHDGHEVTYGIPGTAAFTTATVLMASPVAAPAMPELSLGRRNHQQGTAKIGVFAYDRLTREPVWQAGLAKGASRARDLWLFGLGPFERGGQVVRSSRSKRDKERAIGVSQHASDPLDAYAGSVVFQRAKAPPQDSAAGQGASGQAAPESSSPVQTASHTEPAKTSGNKSSGGAQ